MVVVEMKGQIFILISIFVLLFLFSLRIGTETTDIRQEDMFFEDFSNLKNELMRTIDVSMLNQDNLQDNLDNFISFSKGFYSSKGYTEDVEYTISSVGDSSTVCLNITLESDKSYLKESLIIKRTLVFA